MTKPVIEAAGLGKRYRIREGARTDTLRDAIVNKFRSARSLASRAALASQADDFWALRDISFQINQGDVVGIVGSNGAGKSTLLKILARITEPTVGSVGIRGRVASLLEVGTGFHPELTGRDNIFLNGAILGMSREEIRRKFDEIVEFAGVGPFIDTSVKHYSSGMYVRLAFAVAAHLEPEILIVDEVLAVGDLAFQKKCLGKIQDVSVSEGRTVLFVSHNMSAVQSLCSRAFYLNRGRLEYSGSVADCVAAYAKNLLQQASSAQADLSAAAGERSGDGRARFESVALCGPDGMVRGRFAFSEPIVLKLMIRVRDRLSDYVIGFSIDSLDGVPLLCSNHHDSLPAAELSPGLHEFTILLDGLALSPASYSLTLGISRGSQHGPHDFVRGCATFTVEHRLLVPEVSATSRLDGRPGFFRPLLAWAHAAK